MKEKCYIKRTRSTPTKNCMVALNRDVHFKLKYLSCEAGKSITVVTDELLRFALDRVEVVYPDVVEE